MGFVGRFRPKGFSSSSDRTMPNHAAMVHAWDG
jgi:hypothetical protein